MTRARPGALLLLSFLALGCAGAGGPTLGVVNGNLAPCPAAPHCVSSQNAAGLHATEPIAYETSREEARERFVSIIRSMRRAEVLTDSPDYIHAVFTSRLFHYVDDVEIYLDDRAKVAHIRSSSRAGFYDFGANRRRVKEIRERFLAEKKQG